MCAEEKEESQPIKPATVGLFLSGSRVSDQFSELLFQLLLPEELLCLSINSASQKVFSLVIILFSGLSPPARLVCRPNNTVMFESQAFSLSCEAQDNAAGWALRWFTAKESDKESDCPAGWTSKTRSTCSTNHLHAKDTGVYWCESEYGHHSNAVNLTVKGK